jgi:glycosyltransferase involved in cell wall biosynthesis
VLPKPQDLKPIQKKIIGYTGSIEYRMDFRLVRKIAEYHQDKILFLIGPGYGEEYLKIKSEKMPNIIFAGERQINELPNYLQYFDCVIIPFKKNTLTKSIYPLKINEYLAAGKPVITTNFSEDIFSFRDVAYIVNDENEFLQAVDTAIEENNTDKKFDRIRIAEQNSWKVRVDQFWDILSRE